jgi:hypothetical protein
MAFNDRLKERWELAGYPLNRIGGAGQYNSIGGTNYLSTKYFYPLSNGFDI